MIGKTPIQNGDFPLKIVILMEIYGGLMGSFMGFCMGKYPLVNCSISMERSTMLLLGKSNINGHVQ